MAQHFNSKNWLLILDIVISNNRKKMEKKSEWNEVKISIRRNVKRENESLVQQHTKLNNPCKMKNIQEILIPTPIFVCANSIRLLAQKSRWICKQKRKQKWKIALQQSKNPVVSSVCQFTPIVERMYHKAFNCRLQNRINDEHFRSVQKTDKLQL